MHDGWYIIDSFAPVYLRYIVAGIVQCGMSVTEVAATPPLSLAMAYTGGAISTNFSGQALNLVALPSASTALEASFLRVGGEGSIPSILSPVASPEAFVASLPPTLFQGAVHVFDTIA